MDFRERETGFQEADRRYAELKRQRDAGTISDEEFDAQRQQLIEDTHQSATDSSKARTLSSPKGAESGKTGRQGLPVWIPVAGLGGIALVGIVLVVWVLVPYLRGEPASSEQSGPMAGKQGEPTPGATVDAVFVHRATPENIAENSTYLDNPQINDDPDAILYVAQNWNPGGVGGTYNEHAIGVWYDSSRQRWAIFNQDREAMPEGAAFNVAVLKEPTETR